MNLIKKILGCARGAPHSNAAQPQPGGTSFQLVHSHGGGQPRWLFHSAQSGGARGWFLCSLIFAFSAISVHAQLNVVTTTPDLAALARAIGGEHVAVRSLGRPAEDPHFVEPKPSYIIALNRADVLIEVGLELEVGWLPPLVDQTRNPRIRPGAPGRVDASVGVAALDVPTGPVDRSQGHIHALGNPHYLLDPERARIVARTIAAAFAAADPPRATAYEANRAAFDRELDACLARCHETLAGCRGVKVFTYHKSFSYFAERFGLEVVNTIEPKPGIAPSPAHVTALIEEGRAAGVRAILMERWHDQRVPTLVARALDARVARVAIAGSAQDYCAYLEEVARSVAQACGGS